MNKANLSNGPRWRAFTLVELLVTISIIVILATLMTSGLVSAKEAGRRTICANNGRQLGMATSLYAVDNRNRIPSFNNWLFNPSREVYWGTNFGDLSTGRIYPYMSARKSFMCPTDAIEMRKPRQPSRTRGDRARGFGRNRMRQNSYVMNCQICHMNDLSAWRTPSKTIMYHEANLATNDCSGIGGPMMLAPIGRPGAESQPWTSLPLRHSKSAMIVAGDMSVQRLGYRTILTLADGLAGYEYWYPGPEAESSSRPLD